AYSLLFYLSIRRLPRSTLFPYTTLFRSLKISTPYLSEIENNKKEVTSKIILNLNSEFNISSDWLLFSNSEFSSQLDNSNDNLNEDRKSTRLNSSHVKISYAVFCLKKKKT